MVGTIACLPFAGQLITEVNQAPASATMNMLYLGVFPTALAFTTWAYALARTTAGQMGATTYVVPAIVVLMSWAALGELPGWLTFAGGALCLVGVAVSRTRATSRNSACRDRRVAMLRVTRSARTGRQWTPACEAEIQPVIPREVGVTLQPAQQDGHTGEFGGKVDQ